MTAPHFLVFVGAGSSLSTELSSLKNRFDGMHVIAPAVTKYERGPTPAAIQRAVAALVGALKTQETHREPARLSVWTYEPSNLSQFDNVWNMFGKSAWVELVPGALADKDRPTRLHIQTRLEQLAQLIHVIAYNVHNARKTSPLPLPFRNFRRKLMRDLSEYWYRDVNGNDLRRLIDRNLQRFRQLRTRDGAHRDDRALLFRPARDTECHGQPHPIGEFDSCYVEGRFRFGAALFPGFHYDVSCDTGLLDCTVYDCRGVARELKSERRTYINIFPNDHLLPALGQK